VSSPLHVQLEQYEGPLDLLLDLIRKHRIDIYDIPIAQITARYLDYMRKAMELDMELGSEFVYMAATLIHLKSKMLLPRDPELAQSEDSMDPRQELVDRLLEHQRFQNAAEMLQQKRLLEEATWSHPALKEFLSVEEDPGLDVTLIDLVRTFQSVLERARSRPQFEVAREDYTVPDMILFVHKTLKKSGEGEAVSVLGLFERHRSRTAMIVLFLAILEMVKNQAVKLAQAEAFGDIGLTRHLRFDEFMAGESVARLEEEYR
jgi:segregation and condensation protein A